MFEATDIEQYLGRQGFWSVHRNGGYWDSCRGYGCSWALATATWLGRPEWVETMCIKFYDTKTRETREWTVVK